MSVFDLLAARLYRFNIKLRDLLSEAKEKYEFANLVKPETILRVIALLRNKEPKRKNLLKLEPQNFLEDWKISCKYLQKAFNRMTDLRHGYGVLELKKWAPYSPMIIPLAVMLKEVEEVKDVRNYEKIDKWYWVTVFGQRYDQAVDAQSYSDLKDLKRWIIDEEKIPSFIKDFELSEDEIDVDKQSNAIYRGIMNLIILKGALDFKTGQPPQFDIKKAQDDHIFPKSIYHENSILNRTIITTNQSKINKKPSVYFKEQLKKLGERKVKHILKTHLIPEEALNALLNDDIKKFMELRKKAIIQEIRKRTKL